MKRDAKSRARPIVVGTPAIAPAPAEVVRVEKYDNQTVVRGPNGRFLPGTGVESRITSANASEYGHRHADKRNQAAVWSRIEAAAQTRELVAQGLVGSEAMRKRLSDNPRMSSVEAAGVVAGELQRSALENARERPRDAAAAAKLSLQMQQLAPAEDERAAAVQIAVIVAPNVAAQGEGYPDD